MNGTFARSKTITASAPALPPPRPPSIRRQAGGVRAAPLDRQPHPPASRQLGRTYSQQSGRALSCAARSPFVRGRTTVSVMGGVREGFLPPPRRCQRRASSIACPSAWRVEGGGRPPPRTLGRPRRTTSGHDEVGQKRRRSHLRPRSTSQRTHVSVIKILTKLGLIMFEHVKGPIFHVHDFRNWSPESTILTAMRPAKTGAHVKLARANRRVNPTKLVVPPLS